MVGYVELGSGADTGLGLEILRRLATARPGDKSVILLGSRDKIQREDVAKNTGLEAIRAIGLHVGDPQSNLQALVHMEGEYRRLDLIVRSGGIAAKSAEARGISLGLLASLAVALAGVLHLISCRRGSAVSQIYRCLRCGR
jgi:NAD(P)-dependent dehydrogenase (short-subunit alcohol dehydrogenase family)